MWWNSAYLLWSFLLLYYRISLFTRCTFTPHKKSGINVFLLHLLRTTVDAATAFYSDFLKYCLYCSYYYYYFKVAATLIVDYAKIVIRHSWTFYNYLTPTNLKSINYYFYYWRLSRSPYLYFKQLYFVKFTKKLFTFIAAGKIASTIRGCFFTANVLSPCLYLMLFVRLPISNSLFLLLSDFLLQYHKTV